MQNTDNFGLQIYEGSDIFNPLTVENENMETIDEQMFLNSIATVAQAVEIKSGTVHALTRENTDAAMFRFVATSRFDTGDTFTVDGIQVTGLTTDGKTLADGAYVINANVLCCLTGTVLTLFVAAGEIATAENALKLGGQLPAYYGTASDVQSAITTAQAAGVLANSASEAATAANNNLHELSTSLTRKEFFVYNRTTSAGYYEANVDVSSEGLLPIFVGYKTNLTNVNVYRVVLNADETVDIGISHPSSLSGVEFKLEVIYLKNF